ncbi:hypothetical protein AB4037_12400 [Labrys sp. KB_33_2]
MSVEALELGNQPGKTGIGIADTPAVQFLVENGYVTGPVIECDGGLRLV